MYYYVIRKKDYRSYWQGEPANRNSGFTPYASDAKHYPTFKDAEQEQQERNLNGCTIVIHFRVEK